ncbi:MAG: hypothetical protein KY475_25560 [Planctomycetes bacterium]|nr:hypothetical protein [Planctomycetota bacterium]
MELLNIIAHVRGDARLADLAEEIADRSLDDVRSRVAGRLASLGISEARGYIRSRSAAAVRPHAAAVMKAAGDVRPAWRPQLMEKATEEVVRRLVWEEMSRRRDAAPVRRAA